MARGEVLMELGDAEGALRDFNDAHERWSALGGPPADLLLLRASAYRAVGRATEALTDLGEALERADVFSAAQPLPSEEERKQALLTLRSDIFALRGQCLHEQHQLRPAIAAYDSAIALQPDHGILRLLRAAASYRRHLYLEAHEDVRCALESESMKLAAPLVIAEAQQLLGLTLARCGELWGAVAALSAAMHLHPPTAWLHVQRGTVLLMVERVEAAVTDFTDALELRPGWPLAHHRRGFALKSLQNFEAAAKDFEAAALGSRELRVNYLHVYREQVRSYDSVNYLLTLLRSIFAGAT